MCKYMGAIGVHDVASKCTYNLYKDTIHFLHALTPRIHDSKYDFRKVTWEILYADVLPKEKINSDQLSTLAYHRTECITKQ